MVRVGLSLQPDEQYLELLGGVLREDAELYEIAPETTWRVDAQGELRPNGFHRAFRELARQTGRPCVAHGVGLSMGSVWPGERARRRRWLERLRRDQSAFRYLWYTDHLGATSLAGQAVTLPVAVPMTAQSAARTRRTLRAMQSVVPDVGVETTAQYFLLGEPLDEPSFIRSVLAAPRTHLVLDLHNLLTMGQNLGFDPIDYVARLPLERVIEIHVSGGRPAPKAWLPSRRSMRLDSHDDAVPDSVWAMLQRVWPECPNLRAVVIERMEGTVSSPDVGVIQAEVLLTKRMLRGRGPKTHLPRADVGKTRSKLPAARASDHRTLERRLAAVLTARDPVRALRTASRARDLPPLLRRALRAIDPDGLRIAALLVARLRFERLLRASRDAGAWFHDAPRELATAFSRYHREVPPTAFFPSEEAKLFTRWRARSRP